MVFAGRENKLVELRWASKCPAGTMMAANALV
jgi:hypothetical protein